MEVHQAFEFMGAVNAMIFEKGELQSTWVVSISLSIAVVFVLKDPKRSISKQLQESEDSMLASESELIIWNWNSSISEST